MNCICSHNHIYQQYTFYHTTTYCFMYFILF